MDNRPMAIIAVAVMLAAGFFIVNPLSIWSDWDTTGETEGQDGFSFDVDFTESTFASSWKSDGLSENIVAQGRIKRDAVITFAEIKQYRYAFYVEPYPDPIDTSDWITLPDSPEFWEGGKWNYLKLYSVNIKGDQFASSRAKVTLQVKISEAFTTRQYERGWDGAYLETGGGEVNLYGDQGPFEEGSTAIVYVKTGFTRDQGWDLRLRPPLDRTDLDVKTIKTISDDKEITVEIPIEEGYYRPDSSNKWQVELWTPLFEYGFTEIVSIDFLERAPGKPEITFVAVGDTDASISATSEETYVDITHFEVYAWYGTFTMPAESDTESWIIYDGSFEASGTGTGNVTAVFNLEIKEFKDGIIQVKVYSVDNENRRSEAGYGQLKVYLGEIEDTNDNVSVTTPFLWTNFVILILLVCIILVAIIALMAYKLTRQASIAMMIIIAGAIVTALMTYIVGITPSLALLWV